MIVELTLSELPLLEQAERLHGTKRQAIVSALEVASRGSDLERRLAEAQKELVGLGTELASVRTDQAAGETAHERLNRDLEKARDALASAQNSAASSSKESGYRLQELDRLLYERERAAPTGSGRTYGRPRSFRRPVPSERFGLPYRPSRASIRSRLAP